MTEMKFFVYGSMSEGMVHYEKIKDFIVSSEPATLYGQAYRLKVGYPVILAEGHDLVPGHLVTLRTTDLLVGLLDEFHGCLPTDDSKSLHFRRERPVQVDGLQETAWVYILNPAKLPKTATLIPGGDWKASLAEDPVLTEKLTERQKSYISRLGAILGREIVPIDLSLYRELMNLEMIVDKGRRLALSKIGHEVYRYLS